MKFLDLNGVSILWRRIKETFARKSETVSDISRDDTTFTVTKADGTTFEFTQKDTTYNIATTASSGLMSAADKAKLNGVESGAQPNVIESVSVNGTEQSVTAKGVDITVPTALSDLTDDVGYLTEESDPTVPTWAKQPQKPAYTASEVGALPADTHIPTDVSELNNDAGYLTEHQDISGIEDAIAGLTTKLNTLVDSDDTTLDQLSEIVAYIKNNKSLIDGITTGKVSVDDIVDNLTSTAANKPLSAKQGKALKDMIDAVVVPTKVSQLTNDAGYLTEHQDISGKANTADLSAVATSGSYTDLTDKPTIPTVDNTLTVIGAAADAKKTGDELSSLKEDLTSTESEVINLDSVSNMTGKKAYYNTTYNRVAYNPNSDQQFNVFSVDAGDVVEIRGYGNNTVSGAFAMVGSADMVSTGATYCELLQIIAPDSSSVSFHTVTATIEQAGYLYVNGTISTAGTVKKTTSVTVIKTDKTLTSTVLPANSASVGEAIHVKGVYISNGNYYHFVQNGEKKIIRLFTRRGPNNLFQWNQIILGDVSENGVSVDTTYTGFGTDIIGPISIWNGTLFPGRYGAWSGGNHGITINGTEYATAEQVSFKCMVNGFEVNDNGLYYGDVQFVTANKLYFPQSVTGDDLSQATVAIIEHRYYQLVGTEMRVRVWLECKEDIRVALYYGMQMYDSMFDKVFCINNGYSNDLTDIAEPTDLTDKEYKIILSRLDNGLTLSMSMSDIGLGRYNLNDGSAGYVTLPKHINGGISKTYYKLIYKSPTQPSINAGTNLVWEGVYNLYFE